MTSTPAKIIEAGPNTDQSSNTVTSTDSTDMTSTSSEIIEASFKKLSLTEPQNPNNSNGFARLAGEIRNQIYDLALPKPDTVALSRPGLGPFPSHASIKSQFSIPALAQTCQLLRREGLSWFLTCNRLSVIVYDGDLSDLFTWFYAIGEHTLNLIHESKTLYLMTRYRSQWDMPISRDHNKWVQPLTVNTATIARKLSEPYMHGLYTQGKIFTEWLSQSGMLSALKREWELKGDLGPAHAQELKELRKELAVGGVYYHDIGS